MFTRLTYIKSAVTRNVSEKSINSILDYISTSKQMDLLQNFYETTLGALKETKNERLWFKTNLKLGKLYEEQQDYGKLQKILKELHKSCQTSEGKLRHLPSSSNARLRDRNRRSTQRHPTARSLRLRNSNAHPAEEHQEAQAIIRIISSHQSGHSPSTDHGFVHLSRCNNRAHTFVFSSR